MQNEILTKTISTEAQEPQDVFLKIKHEEKLNLLNNNELNIFMLSISNNKFTYIPLFDLLKDNLGTYVLSRQEHAKNIRRAIPKAIDKFRNVKNNKDSGAGGELGEILLYIFLEYYLGAPKILSKVELKTRSNQYVYNADGIHFYKFQQDDCTHYQLVIGKSKLKSDLKKAIDEAFSSIKSSKLNIANDKSLICSEIFKEVCSPEEAERLKDFIMPKTTEDYEKKISKESAFGIFIGSNFKINAKLPIPKQRENVVQSLRKKAKKIAEYINNNIEQYGLSGYSFYVYFLPFNNIEQDRRNLMEQLLERDEYQEV